MTQLLKASIPNGYNTTTTADMYKWDTGVTLIVDGLDGTDDMIVQYSTYTDATQATIGRLGVLSDTGQLLSTVPDSLFTADINTNYNIYAYIYNGTTRYIITIPVQYREKPEDYKASETDETLITETISQLEKILAESREILEDQKKISVNLKIGEVSEAADGESPSASLDKEGNGYVLNLTLCRGKKGDKGDNISLKTGTTETLEAGSQATTTMTQDGNNYTLSFGIPKGDKGDKGEQGESITLSVGSTETLDAGASATTTMTNSGNAYTLSFGIPKGEKGDKGDAFTFTDFTADELKQIEDATAEKVKALFQDGNSVEYGTQGGTAS